LSDYRRRSPSRCGGLFCCADAAIFPTVSRDAPAERGSLRVELCGNSADPSQVLMENRADAMVSSSVCK